MGKHSNIILIDGDGKILDSIKHVSREMSRIREVLPGRNYVLPPSQGKRNPLQEGAGFLKDVLFNTNEVINLQKFISKSYMGISTVTAGEIIFRAIGKLPQEAYMLTNIDKERIVKSLESFCEMILKKNYHPRIVKDFKGYPKDVLPFVYHQFADLPQTEFNMVSDALDSFYEKKDKIDRIQQKSSYLQKIVKTNLERCQKKIDIQEDVLKQASQADRFRLWGELITANIYQIPKGVKEVSLTNYYEKDGDLLIIPLDQNKTPAQNASKYFKKYTKAKKALDIVSKQLKEAQEEMKYLEGVLDDIHKCTEEIEIEEIKDEMAKEGYLRVRSRPSTKNKRSRSAKDSVPYQFISSDGFKIFVGKNNKQNDYLTLKLAQNHDIWLHTKTIPGSHVIIKTEGKQVPETTLHEAGLLAAFFSKGRNSSNVAVDYCQKKNVKKIGGAKPGMVIYNNYRTIYITPSEDEVVKLRS
jgi:predicted ribosome quality control (RQC) complex YloA/Tae2 family protein